VRQHGTHTYIFTYSYTYNRLLDPYTPSPYLTCRVVVVFDVATIDSQSTEIEGTEAAEMEATRRVRIQSAIERKYAENCLKTRNRHFVQPLHMMNAGDCVPLPTSQVSGDEYPNLAGSFVL